MCDVRTLRVRVFVVNSNRFRTPKAMIRRVWRGLAFADPMHENTQCGSFRSITLIWNRIRSSHHEPVTMSSGLGSEPVTMLSWGWAGDGRRVAWWHGGHCVD